MQFKPQNQNNTQDKLSKNNMTRQGIHGVKE